MSEALLSIKDLSVVVDSTEQQKRILDQVSLDVKPLSVSALVGASGSGKSTTGLSILRLLLPGLSVQKGQIHFQGRDLLKLSDKDINKVRASKISMIFQEPLNAFNPVFTIGYQINEVLQLHTDLSAHKRKERIVELLDLVGMPDAKRIARNYPHQLSGGMRQRAMIAQAIAANPSLIIADEPTSSLDVTLQARIMELFQKLRKELGLSILLITHDLGMVRHLADEVSVIYNGKIVEQGSTKEILDNPKDTYTQKLIEASL